MERCLWHLHLALEFLNLCEEAAADFSMVWSSLGWGMFRPERARGSAFQASVAGNGFLGHSASLQNERAREGGCGRGKRRRQKRSLGVSEAGSSEGGRV